MALQKCRDREYEKVSAGSVVGRLTVIDIVGKSKNGSYIWSCLCECGNSKDVISSSLNSGLVQSCGCLYDSIKGKQAITNGAKDSKEYNSWSAMKQRCYYKQHSYYLSYGGRGIKVCDRWRNSFENFLVDMGKCPEGSSLDRIDPDGDYKPENCRWADNSTQAFNQTKSGSNSSGKTGVHWHKATNKWAASISKDRQVFHLGVFEKFENAKKIRESAEKILYGFTKE